MYSEPHSGPGVNEARETTLLRGQIQAMYIKTHFSVLLPSPSSCVQDAKLVLPSNYNSNDSYNTEFCKRH